MISTNRPDQLLQRLKELERDVKYLELASQTEPESRYLPGTLPVILSAPHGAAHTREGRLKREDEYTAGFACLVGELTGAHVLYARRKSGTDPNFYDSAPYKQHLREIITRAGVGFVLDIHGARASRPYGIALGTMGGLSCPPAWLKLIIRALQAHGFRESSGEETASGESDFLDRLKVNESFAGGHRQQTVTRYACQTLGVYAAQFEINAHLRTPRRVRIEKMPPSGAGNRIVNTLMAFVEMVESIASLHHGNI